MYRLNIKYIKLKCKKLCFLSNRHFQSEKASKYNDGTEDIEILLKIMQDLNTHVWPKATRPTKKPVWIGKYTVKMINL